MKFRFNVTIILVCEAGKPSPLIETRIENDHNELSMVLVLYVCDLIGKVQHQNIDLLNEQQELIGEVVNQITSIAKLLDVMASRIEGIENS